MLVLTVQKFKHLRKMYNNMYKPNITKSDYAYLSPRYTKAYKTVLDRLADKTDFDYVDGLDSCIWGWVKNPYLDFYKNLNMLYDKNDKLYAVFCEIDERDMVLSDYDKFTNYTEGISDDTNFIIESFSESKCIQCSFWNLSPKNIKLVIDLDRLNSNNFIREMWCERLNDKSYLLSKDFSRVIYA